MDIKTDYEFILPKGYIGERGRLFRHGVMRLATAADEVETLNDPRVKENPAYRGILLLSRVITRLEDLAEITPDVVERFFAADLVYLQRLYGRLNNPESQLIDTRCPTCLSPVRISAAEAAEWQKD